MGEKIQTDRDKTSYLLPARGITDAAAMQQASLEQNDSFKQIAADVSRFASLTATMTTDSVTFTLAVPKELIFSGERVPSAVERLSGLPLCLYILYDRKEDLILFSCQLPQEFIGSLLYDGVFAWTLTVDDKMQGDRAQRLSYEESRTGRRSFLPVRSLLKWTLDRNDGRDFNVNLTISVTRLSLVDLSVQRPGSAKLELGCTGKEMFVSVDRLSAHSPFFSAYFAQPRVGWRLHVDPNAFQLILNTVYGYCSSYEGANAMFLKSMLGLAERFQIDAVFKEFEDYLLTMDEEDAKGWLDVADRYQMRRAVVKISNTLTREEIAITKEWMQQTETQLSTETLALMLQRMARL